MTRVIHTGDTHLGYRQYHSPERRADFLDAFRRVVEDAIADDVDAVVHAGDLFHDRSPSLLDVHGTIQVLRDLRDAGVPFLAVVGNHERTREGQWLDLFETLGLATRLGREPTTVEGDGGEVALYGLDYVPPSRRDSLEYEFAAHDAEFAALVAHGPFEPFVPEVRNDRWDLPAVLEAASVEFDAALLGDDHAADTTQIDGTWATYCGSTERVDATERDERGYNVVEFDGDREGEGGVRISRRGVETRPFVMVDLELAPGEGVERVRERIREEDVAEAVVVVRIEGDGEDVHPARVEEFAAERGALIARVSDRRDVETAETAPDVSFADPDEAVRDRIGEMGLSEAATAIDATVRDDGVADANVRDRVRERVEELVDDPGAFERPEVEGTDDAEGPGGDEATGAAGRPGDAEQPDDAEAETETQEADVAEAEPAAAVGAAGAMEGAETVATSGDGEVAEARAGEDAVAGAGGEATPDEIAEDAGGEAETAGVDDDRSTSTGDEADGTAEVPGVDAGDDADDGERDDHDDHDDDVTDEPDEVEEAGEAERDEADEPSADAGDGATTIEDFL